MIFGLFVPATKKSNVFVVDTVKSNQMPNLVTLFNNEKKKFAAENSEPLPEGNNHLSGINYWLAKIVVG
jgi:hypothetical protein